MEITKLRLEQFKKVRDVTLELAPINILVGGNNSGKSSVLEGIHFSVVAAEAARVADTKTFTQDSLLFCPTKDFVDLRHGGPYKNQSNFGFLKVDAEDSGEQLHARVKIYRGRNEGNVGCDATGSIPLRQVISSASGTFSVYVPGLSGIPQSEECRTEVIVRRGVASGEANLFLRNVLLLIKQAGKLRELMEATRVVFPRLHLTVDFDPSADIHIQVNVSLAGAQGRHTPLELTGTGVQQALQIFSYTVLFRPKVILLDEPDSHLHPDNQGLLAKSLLAIANESGTKAIISTHSRHLVDALYDESNIVWLKEGTVFSQGEDVLRIPLLMDLGALDSFEKIREGAVDWVILSEDASLDLVKLLAEASGFESEEFLVYSYKGSTNLQSALTLSVFINEIAPETNVIIHRDRDFMTDREVGWIEEKIQAAGATPFITSGSDIEAYFISSSHISELLEVDSEEVDRWKSEIAHRHHNKLTHCFSRKRDEVKYMYRNRDEEPPETLDLLGEEVPLPSENRLGKFMLSKIRGEMHSRFGRVVDLAAVTDDLGSEQLAALRLLG